MPEFGKVPADVEEWENPIPQLLLDHLDTFEAMDTLASRHEREEGALPPSEMMGKLAEIDVVAIGRSAIRLHNTAQESYKSIIDDRYNELLEDHWKGTLADTFREFMEGGGGYCGVETYLFSIRRVSEVQALSFLNMAEEIKASITELVPGLRDLMQSVETYVAMDEQTTGVKHFIDEVIIGKFLVRAQPVLAVLATCISWALETYFRVGKSVEGSRHFLSEYAGQADEYGNSVPSLTQRQW